MAEANINQDGTKNEEDDNWEDVEDTIEDELVCAVCYELMVQPTTLNCGHSFCRCCLAKSILQSRKTICPMCNQVWRGHPLVNVALRSTISRSHPDDLKHRIAEIDTDPTNQTAVKKFDELLKQSVYQHQRQQEQGLMQFQPLAEQRINQNININQQAIDDGITFCKQCLTLTGAAIVILLAIFLVVYWVSQSTEKISENPVNKWTVDDVQSWLEGLGPWAPKLYGEAFKTNQIDGSLLKHLNEEDLKTVFGMENPVHLRVFMTSLYAHRDFGPDIPTDFWDYRQMFSWRCHLLMIWIPYCPRFSLALLAFWKYNDMFLPFMKYTVIGGFNVTEVNLYTHQFEPLGVIGWIEVLWGCLAVPYMLIAVFAKSFIATNTLAAVITITHCIALTANEAQTLYILFRSSDFKRKHILHNEWISLKSGMKTNVIYMMLSMVLWPIIPSGLIRFGTTVYIYIWQILVISQFLKTQYNLFTARV